MTDWQQALTAQVAHNIEYHRTRRGLKRIELAARCTALGLPTKRPALAALLDGHRQTITLQELVVLAEALDVSVAELVVPLHSGLPSLSGPTHAEHAFDAASRLFGIDDDRVGRPYRPFRRYRAAAARFERANLRLAELSHAIATGAEPAGLQHGRPHPASEILAAEAALSRLLAAKRDLAAQALLAPPLDGQWAWLDDERPVALPVLDLLPDEGSGMLPLLQFRLHPDDLPSARLVTPPSPEPPRPPSEQEPLQDV